MFSARKRKVGEMFSEMSKWYEFGRYDFYTVVRRLLIMRRDYSVACFVRLYSCFLQFMKEKNKLEKEKF